MNSEQLYNSVIQNLPVGFSMVDRYGNIKDFNKAAEQITGYVKSEVMGMSHIEILHDPQDADSCHLFKRVLKKKGKVVSAETIMNTKKGEQITAAVTSFPLYDERGEFCGGVEIFRDITDQKRRERERKNFLSMFVHDMKSPLLSSKGFVLRMLSMKAGPLTKKQKNYLDMVHDGLSRLEKLIIDFLDFSKFEAKRYKPKMIKISMEDVIHRNIETLKLALEENNINIFFKPAKKIPVIQADEMMLNRVLTNLLSNAIAYTEPNGTITIDCEVKEAEVLVKVSNPGACIPGNKLPYIFDAFHRVKKDDRGSGLGLAITKKIVELHKGRIWAESGPDGRTVVIFTLPVRHFK